MFEAKGGVGRWVFKMLVAFDLAWAMTTRCARQSVQSLDLPPQQSMKDQNDVNWLNAMYEPESRELSIGVEGADLTFVRHNSSGGWGSNMLNSVTYGAYTVTLLLGYSSKVFDRPGTAGNPANDGILRPKDHDGSILTETGSGFTYTARDGSVFFSLDVSIIQLFRQKRDRCDPDYPPKWRDHEFYLQDLCISCGR
ncbi:MAG: hypothetical protein IPK89_13205 [Sphingomonadales bacterium]|nr:hypothetical protein [Sphingomonadales bacterium]